MNMLRFLLLSVFVTTFASEAMAQRRTRSGSTVRSNSPRTTTTRRPTTTTTRRPTRPSTARRAPVRTTRPRVNRAPVYRNRIPYRNRVTVNQYRHINRRFARTNNYYNWLRINHSNFIQRNWFMYPTARLDGFFLNNNYPYFVFNGYQHRYSGYDRCNYQLVDGYNNVSVQSYFNQFCNVGYNGCAITRDNLNRSSFSNRYYCAESFR
jgi:hypothetical protein